MKFETKRNFKPIPAIGALLLLVGLVVWMVWPSDKGSTKTADKGQVVNNGGSDASNDVSTPSVFTYMADALNVGVCTWPGYGTAIWFNNGLLTNAGSRFLKEYGLKVNFNIMDDPTTNRPAFLGGQIDVIWATIDSYVAEAGDMSVDPAYTKITFTTDCSGGGDVFVVKGSIKSVADLRGKTITFGSFSPSHSFLLHILNTAGMTVNDVNLLPVATPQMARDNFLNGLADGAVIWSPDDQTCLADVEGSHVLTSTKTASNLIYNVFLVRKAYLAEHKERLVKFFEGWMVANAELKAGGEPVKDAVAQALVDNMGFWTNVDDAKEAMGRVKFLTMGDNQNLFGMNSDYKGVKAPELYSKFTKLYRSSGDITKDPPAWSEVFDRSILIAVSKDLSGAIHKAEGRKEFTPVTDAIAAEPALTSKAVTVTFATGSYQLDDDAKNIIKREFGNAVQTYRDARIRVVGNTDNTGSVERNTTLSLKRAKAVKAYLVSEYDSDPNRFIVIGNGPKAAIADGVEGESEEYRRTDFELVQD